MTDYPPPGDYPPPSYYPPPGDYPPPGYYPAQGGMAGPPDSYLVWAILSTLFCCLPFGIVSIVKSSQVASLWAQGQFAASHQAAADAKKWAIWSAVAGVVAGVLWAAIMVSATLLSVSGSGY